MYTLVTGGFRSGRSNYALRRASELGQPPWLYVSAGTETDEAVQKRIQRQRRDVEAIWRTGVMPPNILDLVDAPALVGMGAAVFDGVSDWIESQLEAHVDAKKILDDLERLADRMYRSRVPIIAVTHEMGLGTWPADPQDEALLRAITSANQILAALAGSVVMMVSGLPLKVR